jgi:hypothetical protein
MSAPRDLDVLTVLKCCGVASRNVHGFKLSIDLSLLRLCFLATNH